MVKTEGIPSVEEFQANFGTERINKLISRDNYGRGLN